MYLATQRQRGAGCELHRLPIQDRQCTGQRQADWAGVLVRRRTKLRRAIAEQLGPRQQLHVDLEADDHLPSGMWEVGCGRMLDTHGLPPFSDRSRAYPAANIPDSSKWFASSCTPTG